jgi:hypothetical protein
MRVSSQCRDAADAMLRDMAFVLQATRSIKVAILAEQTAAAR